MPKRKKQKDVMTCPCCKQVQYISNVEIVLKAYAAYHRKHYPNFKMSDKELAISFENDDFVWACDDCFKNKRAILSVPDKMYNSGSPQLVYFDTPLSCERCTQDFIFSKKEKQFWYEGLDFHVDSSPVNCLECRRIVRKEKKDNARLSDLLKNKEQLSKEELQEVSEIYFRMGKEERMKMYQTLSRKK